MADDERKPLIPITGTPADQLNLPRGCAFAARCPECRKICLRKKPPRVNIGPGHFSECWLNRASYAGLEARS
jgi:oligopeptide transport system ATP-binding protein